MKIDKLQAEILCQVLGKTDAALEPERPSAAYLGDGALRTQHSAMKFETEQECRAEGVAYAAKDRSPSGRSRLSTALSVLHSRGFIEVSFCAGRPGKIKLTDTGDTLARTICLQPTRDTAMGIFHRLCSLLDGVPAVMTWPPGEEDPDSADPAPQSADWWHRFDHILEHALVYPSGQTTFDTLTGPGVLPHLQPWINSGHVTFYPDTNGLVFYSPTDCGWTLFQDTDWTRHDLDWEECWQRACLDSRQELGHDFASDLRDMFRKVFATERESLRTGAPRNSQELGRIPWPRTN